MGVTLSKPVSKHSQYLIIKFYRNFHKSVRRITKYHCAQNSYELSLKIKLIHTSSEDVGPTYSVNKMYI